MASTVVPYVLTTAPANFTSLLVAGTNTIEIINHNGFQGAAIEGSYSVSVAAVPEPCAATLLLASLAGIAMRRRRQSVGK